MSYSLNSLKGGYIGDLWGYIGIMEKKMETTIMGYLGFRGLGSKLLKGGIYRGLYRGLL